LNFEPLTLNQNMKEILKEQRLLGITLLFVCLFNFPILSIVNQSVFIGGIPVLYVYVFVNWAIMIALVAWITEKSRRKSEDLADE